jgi:hypothetical protein
VTGRGHAPVAFMARGGRTSSPPWPERVACPSPSWPERDARRTGDLLSTTVRSSLAASASEDLVADPSELPRLRRRTSMKAQLAPAGPHESLVLRSPQVRSSPPHPLAAAHPAASCRGSSQPLHRASPSLPAGELAAAAGGTTGSGMKGKRHRG